MSRIISYNFLYFTFEIKYSKKNTSIEKMIFIKKVEMKYTFLSFLKKISSL